MCAPLSQVISGDDNLFTAVTFLWWNHFLFGILRRWTALFHLFGNDKRCKSISRRKPKLELIMNIG